MKLVKLLFCLLLASPAFSQYDGKDPELVSRYRPGILWFMTGMRPAKIGRPRKYDRLIVDLTYNDWVNDSSLFLVKPPSLGWNLNFMKDIPLNDGNGLSLGIGLSYRYQRVRYDGIMAQDTLSRASVWMLGDQPGIDKSVFGSHGFAVPLELRLRVKKWKHVKLHVGGHIGYRTQTFTKVWMDDSKSATKNKDLYDADPFFYGVHARLGIRNWALFANYSLTKQFKSDKSTSLQPIAFGLSISLF